MLLICVIENLPDKNVKIVTGSPIGSKGKGPLKGISAIILTNGETIQASVQAFQTYTKIPNCLADKPETGIVLYKIMVGHFRMEIYNPTTLNPISYLDLNSRSSLENNEVTCFDCC